MAEAAEAPSSLSGVTTLTFDIFGTVLDLSASLIPAIARLLNTKESPVDSSALWAQWRSRQRVEQYQDTLLMQGHGGYLETCRRLSYTASVRTTLTLPTSRSKH